MDRNASFVFVSWIEILVITIIGVAIVAVSDQYCTGLTLWAVHIQSLLLIPTLCILLLLFTIQRRDNVEGEDFHAITQPAGALKNNYSGGDKDNNRESSNMPDISNKETSSTPPDTRTLLMKSSLISSTATAYCGIAFLAFFSCTIAFLQALPFSYTLSGEQETIRDPQGGLYNHSQRIDWVHATVGGST